MKWEDLKWVPGQTGELSGPEFRDRYFNRTGDHWARSEDSHYYPFQYAVEPEMVLTIEEFHSEPMFLPTDVFTYRKSVGRYLW